MKLNREQIEDYIVYFLAGLVCFFAFMLAWIGIKAVNSLSFYFGGCDYSFILFIGGFLGFLGGLIFAAAAQIIFLSNNKNEKVQSIKSQEVKNDINN